MSSQYFCEDNKNIKNAKMLFFGGRSIMHGFSLSAGVLEINPREE
jgi:hypothetical protein